ncbi:MAG: aminotransferase class V-fold PLP-dependent enzyme [Anaerolineales bacterium]
MASEERLVEPDCREAPGEDTKSAFAALERAVHAALETYSNVHRGTGHFSMASTALFERAREVVLEYLGLDAEDPTVVFCTPHRADVLTGLLPAGAYQVLSSADLGLPLGLRAVAVARGALPKGRPFETGGGVVKLVSDDSVVWADAPERFEAGTPPVVNVVAFAKALQLTRIYGEDAFKAREESRPVVALLYQDDLMELQGRALLRALQAEHIGRGIEVPTTKGARPYVNFDNGASTPTFAPIWESVRRTWRQPEEVQRALIDEVRALCLDYLGASPESYDILFCSNATEALNLFTLGLPPEEEGSATVVVNTLLEHHANELPWRYRSDVELLTLPVDDEGFLNPDELEAHLQAYNRDHAHGRQRIRLVAVSGASNVLGSFNDVQGLARLAHVYGAEVLVDAAQLVAHRAIEMEAWGIDHLVFSAHKVYAPFGSGAIVTRRGLLRFAPADEGAVCCSGEENVVGVVALGKALDLLRRVGLDVVESEERVLTGRLLQGLQAIDGVQIFGVQGPRSPRFDDKSAVVAFSFDAIPHNLAAKFLAERGGIGVRNGCFCAHPLVKHLMHIQRWRELLAEVGLAVVPRFTTRVLPGVIRASLGLENDEEDVEIFLEAVAAIAAESQPLLNRFLGSTYNGTPFLPGREVVGEMATFVRERLTRVFGNEIETESQSTPLAPNP